MHDVALHREQRGHQHRNLRHRRHASVRPPRRGPGNQGHDPRTDPCRTSPHHRSTREHLRRILGRASAPHQSQPRLAQRRSPRTAPPPDPTASRLALLPPPERTRRRGAAARPPPADSERNCEWASNYTLNAGRLSEVQRSRARSATLRPVPINRANGERPRRPLPEPAPRRRLRLRRPTRRDHQLINELGTCRYKVRAISSARRPCSTSSANGCPIAPVRTPDETA